MFPILVKGEGDGELSTGRDGGAEQVDLGRVVRVDLEQAHRIGARLVTVDTRKRRSRGQVMSLLLQASAGKRGTYVDSGEDCGLVRGLDGALREEGVRADRVGDAMGACADSEHSLAQGLNQVQSVSAGATWTWIRYVRWCHRLLLQRPQRRYPWARWS
jgi:hypothetical protein